MKSHVPYLKWRDGRPRWEPGPRLRASGWTGRDLKSDAGEWLGLGPAIEAAIALNREVASRRASAPEQRRRPPTPTRVARSGRQLYEMWGASPFAAKLARSTRRDYDSKAQLFLAEFGDLPVAAIEKHHLFSWWEELHASHGAHMARGTIAVASSLLTYATRKGWIAHNPALRMQLPTLPPRQMLWPAAAVTAYVEAADASSAVAVADAIVVAVHSSQRLGDVLALEMPRLEGGRFAFRQAKRGTRVSVPFTPALAERIEAIKRRRADAGRLPHGLLIEADAGAPFTPRSFNEAFRAVRAIVVAAHPEHAELRFQDLRDTAVTRLALAGCTIAETAAITGHSVASITTIIKHYLVLQPEMADAGIAKLTAWLESQGIAL